MDIEQLLIYSVVSLIYIISPGPAVFLAISNGMTAGTRALVMSSAGNITGLLLLSTVSVLGLGALIVASATIFFFVKTLGASYLIYLGFKHFRTQRMSFSSEKTKIIKHRRLFSYFNEGFLLAVTNPKAIIFFTALFPQFLNIEAALILQFLSLTAIFMAISFSVLFSYGSISISAKGFLASEQRMRWFHRLSGGLFIGMGISLLQLKNSPS